MTLFSVILKNDKDETFSLDYRLKESDASLIWIEGAKKATAQKEIESSRFYNFQGQTENELDSLIVQFEAILKTLVKTQPQLGLTALKKNNDQALQESLNQLHRNFAHNHLIEKSISSENRLIWSEFNFLIHRIEVALLARRTPTKINLCRIAYSYKDFERFDIPEKCFEEFTLMKNFGDLQIAYCQVGRHLQELFISRDSEVPVEHIQPARYFSANAELWFGPDLDQIFAKKYEAEIELWFKNHERKFNSAGIYWERKDKALGSVTVANLNRTFDSLDEKRQFQKEIAGFNRVLRVQIP